MPRVLLIPDLNDNSTDLRDAARFVARDLGVHMPWHISRFHSACNMRDVPSTSVATLRQAWEVGLAEGLHTSR